MEEFRETPNCVLFATASFWQGVDVPGDQLSCVIIDKLPFSVPSDPVVEARIGAIRKAGGNPFEEYQIPDAVLSLKQGFGRLIRSSKDRGVLALLDNRVISAPVIREPILGGAGQISGSFTYQEVNDLAVLLRAGALPAPIKVLEERTVGPALGADSIAAGKIASIIGFVLVMIFMVVAYGIFGIAADIALILNLFLIVGALSALQATLTLPGIAGIVLTIGMAVDANVLVFERIREEIRSGKTPFNAMEAGYRRAIGTILDANITTFIAAAILTPPDPLSQLSLAIPIILLYEISIYCARLIVRQREKADNPEDY